jgi:hypothetical protein
MPDAGLILESGREQLPNGEWVNYTIEKQPRKLRQLLVDALWKQRMNHKPVARITAGSGAFIITVER